MDFFCCVVAISVGVMIDTKSSVVLAAGEGYFVIGPPTPEVLTVKKMKAPLVNRLCRFVHKEIG